jgi:NAD(P)H-flavin reductase
MEEASGRDVVVVAGGLGLAPLRPALYRLLAERKRYGEIVLVYGTRGPDDILFRRELESWRRRLDIDIQVTVDHATDA